MAQCVLPTVLFCSAFGLRLGKGKSLNGNDDFSLRNCNGYSCCLSEKRRLALSILKCLLGDNCLLLQETALFLIAPYLRLQGC